MANTGILIPLTLQEVLPPIPPGTPTGNTKPNTPSNPDYIAPYLDTVNCAVVYTTACPTSVIFTPSTGQFIFEFSLPNEVVLNPAIAKIKYLVYDSTPSEFDTFTVTLPNTTPNYFTHTFSGLPADTYSMNVEYLDDTDAVVATCVDLIPSVTVT